VEDSVATGLPGPLSAVSWAVALSVIFEDIVALLGAEGWMLELVRVLNGKLSMLLHL